MTQFINILLNSTLLFHGVKQHKQEQLSKEKFDNETKTFLDFMDFKLYWQFINMQCDLKDIIIKTFTCFQIHI